MKLLIYYLKIIFVNRIIKIDTENVLNFNNNKGLVDGDGIIKLINSIIKFKTGLESMTLLESYQKYNCVLGISVTNITNNKLEVLTYKTDPDLDSILKLLQ